MVLKSINAIEAKPVNMEGAKNVKKRLLLSEADGAPNFRMRLFELEKEGCTPFHAHPYEHEVLILEGKGELVGKEQQWPLQVGSVVLVPPNEEHQFRNTGDKALKLICLIPILKEANQ
ncbi:cupin [candidate division KSB1 bacterium]|nr:MAG: cupin [candidate division KSB1 bacterium]